MRFTVACAVASIGIALSAFAQPPHVGAWAIDYASSDRGEVVWGFDDLGSLLYSILISDPELLTQPVEQKRSWLPRPNEKVLPFDCQEPRGEPQSSTP